MGSACEEQYCLRWHDFQANVTSAFSDIRDDEDLLDVTLVCPDGHMLRAHKLMLSACSPMFKAMLQRNNHPQPVIFLHGVQHSDISAILNFMYHGEVNVSEGNISTFLSIAEDLKVRGLTHADLQDRMPPALKKTIGDISPKRQRLDDDLTSPVQATDRGTISGKEQAKANVKIEPNQTLVVTPDLPASSEKKDGRKHVVLCEPKEKKILKNTIQLKDERARRPSVTDFGNQEGVSYHRLGGRDADDPMSTMIVALSHKGWHCPECLHTSTTKGNLKSHILSGRHKLFEKSHACQYCQRSYSTRQSLQVHISTHHRYERDAEYHKDSSNKEACNTSTTAAANSSKGEASEVTNQVPSVSAITAAGVTTVTPQVTQIVQAYPQKTHAIGDGHTPHQFVNYLSQQATMVGNAFATTTATPMPLNYQVSATNDLRLPHNV